MAAPLRVLSACTCEALEDADGSLGFRCCKCAAFYGLQLPVGGPQFCACGHVHGTVRVEPPKVRVSGFDRFWARLESIFGGSRG